MFHNLVRVVLDTHSSLVFGLAWFGWIYETDRFVGFVGSSWGGHLARLCFGVKRGWSVARLPGARGEG